MSRASLRDLQPLAPSVSVDIPSFPWKLWGVRHVVSRLGICESRRRLLHMMPGLLPLVLAVVPHKDPWGIPLILSFLAIQVSMIAFAITREMDFARPGE